MHIINEDLNWLLTIALPSSLSTINRVVQAIFTVFIKSYIYVSRDVLIIRGNNLIYSGVEVAVCMFIFFLFYTHRSELVLF